MTRFAPGEGGGLGDEELGAAARHEHPGVDGDPQTAEFGPADDVFQGQAARPALDHGGDLGRGPGGGEDQLRLVLGEDTARRRAGP